MPSLVISFFVYPLQPLQRPLNVCQFLQFLLLPTLLIFHQCFEIIVQSVMPRVEDKAGESEGRGADEKGGHGHRFREQHCWKDSRTGGPMTVSWDVKLNDRWMDQGLVEGAVG